MDSYQQPHHHMRPPTPPPPADTHQYHHYQQPAPPIPPVPPQGSWYSNQFHYHPSSHSPSPSPQWAPPPPPPPPQPQSDHHPPFSSSYAPPSHHPSYRAPLSSHSNQFPPPPHSRPHLSPQIPQSYPQEWGNSNWGHHHAWDYHVAHNLEVDWAAKARAWASAKASMDDQHPESQFTPIGRQEEQGGFHEHQPQAVNYPYQDVQQQPILPSNHHQFPVPSAHHRPPTVYMQETSSMNYGASSYLPNGHLPYPANDGTSHAAFSHQESFLTSSSVHQQEVPSSYSSVAGKEGIMEQKDQLYKSVASLPNSSAQEGQHFLQPSLPAVSRSVLTEQPFAYGNHTANPSTDLSDQPLDFAPGFNRDRDALMQPGYATHHDSAVTLRGMDPVAAVPPINSWAPVVPGSVYPSIPPVIPSGPQQDLSVSVSGNVIPPFGRFPGPSFQPTLPSTGAPFGLGPGPALNPGSGFLGDAYGSVSERPKKASVPNWLKEEIIKNASVITKSSLEHPKEDTHSIEDEGVDRSFGNGDQVDSKSIDSSRSTEEEDEEDYREAAKTAAINQEIKRVLTEVLLKVTDELFDEIATKVIDEDDLPVEVDQNTPSLNHKVSTPPAPVDPISSVPAKVVVPVKSEDSGTEVVSEKHSSSSHGNVLGLANYSSDDDNDDDNEDADADKEIQNSSEPHSIKNSVIARADNKNLPGDEHNAVENSSLLVDLDEHGKVGKDLLGGLNKSSSVDSRNNKITALSEFAVDREDGEYEHASPKVVSQGRGEIDFGKAPDGSNGSGSKGMLGEEGGKTENPSDSVYAKKTAVPVDDPHRRETRIRPGQYDRNEIKKSSYGKDSVKEVESRSRKDEKQGEDIKRHDEKHLRKEKTNDQNGSKERIKQRDPKPGERSEESESRKRSAHHDTKEDMKEADRVRRTYLKEANNSKRESTNIKEEGDARHNLSSDVSRHKRRRSSPISSRGRNSKENSVTHAHDSSDDESDDSKRKLHARRRNSSPSPVKSRRRQLSRSPHSKRSQRRHSPYSSLETNRGRRRSRSRSPMQQRR